MSSLRKKRKKHGINILPLLDVLTVILFFFLMTMQFRQTRTLNLLLPEIQTAGTNQMTDKIVLAVDKEGKLHFNNEPVPSAEFTQLLETAARITTASPILIHADEDTPLKQITWIMDQCREKGFRKIRIQSR
jgi:biopolymer transport protein ExbD